jgi:hypothetical protein
VSVSVSPLRTCCGPRKDSPHATATVVLQKGVDRKSSVRSNGERETAEFTGFRKDQLSAVRV